jgi:hypothetical protein
LLPAVAARRRGFGPSTARRSRKGVRLQARHLADIVICHALLKSFMT